MAEESKVPFRCGYVAIVGRPNVGKSTIMNELIGAKISITSRKAQTTRHRILGIQTDDESQFIYIDTPGFQTRYSNPLNRNLNRTVKDTLASADVILFIVDQDIFSPADKQVLDLIPKEVPTILVINKTDKLTDDEYAIIKTHPEIGGRILENIKNMPELSSGARWHHERYDGKGYPDGLKGEDIPEVARIIAVADAYDAMSSNRSYRGSLDQSIVRQEIEKGKGTQFDPAFADIMLEMMDEDTEYKMRDRSKE